MDEKKKIAEIKKLHSLKQKPLPIKYIKRKYTRDENTNKIFYSRFNQLPDDFLREYLYKLVFTESIRVIDTIEDHYDPITNKTIKWWIYKDHGWNCLGGKQARNFIQAYTESATNHHRFHEINRFNEWMRLHDQEIRTFVTSSDIRTWKHQSDQMSERILSTYYDHNTSSIRFHNNTSDIRIAAQTSSIYHNVFY